MADLNPYITMKVCQWPNTNTHQWSPTPGTIFREIYGSGFQLIQLIKSCGPLTGLVIVSCGKKGIVNLESYMITTYVV